MSIFPRGAINIRNACADDADMLSQFYATNSSFFFDNATNFRDYLVDFLGLPNKICIVACESCDNLHGYCIVGFSSIDLIERPRGGRLAYLGEILVATNNRHQRVATQMISACIRMAMTENCHRIILHCSAELQGLYSTMGFESWDSGMKLELPICTTATT